MVAFSPPTNDGTNRRGRDLRNRVLSHKCGLAELLHIYIFRHLSHLSWLGAETVQSGFLLFMAYELILSVCMYACACACV